MMFLFFFFLAFFSFLCRLELSYISTEKTKKKRLFVLNVIRLSF